MATLPAQDLSVDLRAVTVRPTWGAQEHRRWDRLVAEHHYLPFHGVIGKGLRHVAVHGETWLALIGWQPGAFKLAARDRWIGWLIAGRKPGGHLTDLQHPWRRIRARAGLDDVRIHDLRHSFASGGLLVGEGLPMIGKLLGHTQVQTTARYAHLANDPVKSAANRIASRIAEVSG